jgi:hypothetical protein
VTPFFRLPGRRRFARRCAGGRRWPRDSAIIGLVRSGEPHHLRPSHPRKWASRILRDFRLRRSHAGLKFRVGWDPTSRPADVFETAASWVCSEESREESPSQKFHSKTKNVICGIWRSSDSRHMRQRPGCPLVSEGRAKSRPPCRPRLNTTRNSHAALANTIFHHASNNTHRSPTASSFIALHFDRTSRHTPTCCRRRKVN